MGGEQAMRRKFIFVMALALLLPCAGPAARFKPINDPNHPDSNVQMASNTTTGQSLAFNISGKGTFKPSQQNRTQGSGETSKGSGAAPAGYGPDRVHSVLPGHAGAGQR